MPRLHRRQDDLPVRGAKAGDQMKRVCLNGCRMVDTVDDIDAVELENRNVLCGPCVDGLLAGSTYVPREHGRPSNRTKYRPKSAHAWKVFVTIYNKPPKEKQS